MSIKPISLVQTSFYFAIAIFWGIPAGVVAQTCAGGTATVSSSTTSQFATTANNQCLEITSSGSITAANPVTNSAYTSFSISNAGTIESTGFGINNDGGSITTLTNLATGSITNSQPGALNIFAGNIATLNNFGSIASPHTTRSTDLTIGIGMYYSNQITTLNNYSSGSISADRGIEIYSTGSGASANILNLNNYGSISGFDSGIYLHGSGDSITTLTNSGTILGSYFRETSPIVRYVFGYGINNSGTIGALINLDSGIISSTGYSAIKNLGTIGSIVNSGQITSQGTGIENSSVISTITNSNSGIISGTNYGTAITNTGTIGTITNNGQISADSHGYGVLMWGNGIINSLTNNGTIASGYTGIELDSSQNTIQTLTNNGTITSGQTYGITINDGSIGILNNAQGVGNLSGALTYTGKLPVSYNIIINSPTVYGQLAVTGGTGSTTFGIYSGSTVRNGTYAAVLSSTDNTITLTSTSGSYGSGNWSLSPEAACTTSCIYDLIISGVYTGPSTADTQTSLQNTAGALQGIYTLQNAVIANSFSYDCDTFGANNICVSAGGRNTAVSTANGLNNTSGLLIAAYRPHANYRIGAYADQNLSVNNAGAGVNLGNNTPLLGLFGTWNERLDGTGTEVKVSAAYGQKNTTITRQVVGTSESGSGSSQLNSQGAQVAAKYGFGVATNTIVSPYVGIRYTQNNMGGYTEGASSSVTAPLTYSALNTNATTVLAGVGASYRGIPQTTLFASAGVESDTNTQNGSINATGVSGLTPVNFNPNPVKTRPTAMVGAAYSVEKNQRLGVTGIYRQEAYQATATTTVMATYTVGF